MLLPTRNFRHSTRRPLPGRMTILLLVVVVLSMVAITPSFAFVPTNFHIQPQCLLNDLPTPLFAEKSKDNENAELLEKARKLREEASLLEDNLREISASSTTTSAAAAAGTTPVVHKKLEESTWTLKYRFSSQPAPKDSDENKNTANKPKTFYSGNIDLRLKEDGYSEQMPSDNETDIQIVKIWGWDKETSNEDNLDYLLFSMDVKFPQSDPDLSNQTERYYFQARIEQDQNEGISLKEGTITVKKDVTEKTGGMWGFFNVAGILTEFRYTGDFVARAS